MAILEIIGLKNPILRQRSRPVLRFDDKLQQLIDDMIETMRHKQGVGLAAPQVNIPWRLAVIEALPLSDDDGNEIENSRELYVIVNPEIVWTSRRILDGMEACLSIPGYVGEVNRYEAVRVRGQDRYGRKATWRVEDWTARIFQHEIDHLNGVLYIDRLTAPDNFWTDEAFQQKFGDQENKPAAD